MYHPGFSYVCLDSWDLATVIYDTPVIKEQSISTKDNVAYGGTIPLKQNEAYMNKYTLTSLIDIIIANLF